MRVSIVLLTQGTPRATLLEEAVKSVLRQTHSNWELLVVSEDPRIQELFSQRGLDDLRIRQIAIEPGLGLSVLSAGRNEGLRNAQGDLICFLDDDNTFHPLRLESAVEKFQRDPSLDVCLSQVAFVKDGATLRVLPEGQDFNAADLQDRNLFDLGAICIRAEALRRVGWFDERLEGAEDWDLVRRIYQHDLVREYIPRPLYFYRIHENQLSNDFYGERYEGPRERTYRYLKEKSKPRVKVLMAPRDQEKYSFTQGYIWDQMEKAIRELGYQDFEEDKVCEHDVALCLAPFQFDDLDGALEPFGDCRKVAVLMEDPWVFERNQEIVQKFDYIFTNEEVCRTLYRKQGHSRVYTLPTSAVAPEHLVPPAAETDYDLVMCGFPYYSRMQEAQKIVELLHGKARVGIFGWNWPKIQGADVHGIIDPSELGHLYARSKMVLVNYCSWADRAIPEMERVMPLITPTRGFIEAASAALPIISLQREGAMGYFGYGDWYYHTPEQAAKLVLKYISLEGERQEIVKKMNKHACKFSYRERMINMMNIINSDLKKGDIE